MKNLVVVLAAASIVSAVPEADPAQVLATLPYTYPTIGLPYAYAPHSVAPFALPYVLASPIPAHAINVEDSSVVIAPAAAAPTYTPHDCVTPSGCQVRYLKDLGLARRKRRESDPSAEAAAVLTPAATLPLNPYFGTLPYRPFYGAFNPYFLNPYFATTAAIPAANPAVVTAVKAAPAPVATPIHAVFHSPVFHAPLVRAPVVTPIIAKTTKPVTYTHLGAHPISPTTVFETETAVVGHTIAKRETDPATVAILPYSVLPAFHAPTVTVSAPIFHSAIVPATSSSFQHVSRVGSTYGIAQSHGLGKRSADATEPPVSFLPYAGGYPLLPYAYPAPLPLILPSSSFQHVSRPGSTYGISQTHPGK